jgi:hypothetical protein
MRQDDVSEDDVFAADLIVRRIGPKDETYCQVQVLAMIASLRHVASMPEPSTPGRVDSQLEKLLLSIEKLRIAIDGLDPSMAVLLFRDRTDASSAASPERFLQLLDTAVAIAAPLQAQLNVQRSGPHGGQLSQVAAVVAEVLFRSAGKPELITSTSTGPYIDVTEQLLAAAVGRDAPSVTKACRRVVAQRNAQEPE